MSKCKIIAIANQKGGVGKTTTTFNLGVALTNLGNKVLLIDVDPQGDLTTCMGYYDADELLTIADVMNQSMNDEEINLKDVIITHEEKIDLIPSNLDLSALEMTLVNAMSREYTLRNSIQGIKDEYDYILLDCPPSLGMITINALACADKVIIPVQTQFLAARNMGQLLKTVSKVKRQINPQLNVEGILLTLVDGRTNLSKETQLELYENYGSMIKIFNTKIPNAIKMAESTMEGKSIFSYYKNSKVANAYYEFAKEVENNGKQQKKDAVTYNR